MIPQETKSSNSSEIKKLSNYLTFSEQNNSLPTVKNVKTVLLLNAQLNREELYECSLVDDTVVDGWADEEQNKTKVEQVLKRIGGVSKYLDEDVNIPSSKFSTPAILQHFSGFSLNSNNQDKIEHYPSVKVLKSKYEPIKQYECEDQKKNNKRSKVKHMAQMFNNKISQIMNAAGSNSNCYKQLENELSPEAEKEIKMKRTEALKPPKYPTYSNKSEVNPDISQQEALVLPDKFCQLSVKEKATMYQNFILSQNNSDYPVEDSKYNKSITGNVEVLLKPQLVENVDELVDVCIETMVNKDRKEFPTLSTFMKSDPEFNTHASKTEYIDYDSEFAETTKNLKEISKAGSSVTEAYKTEAESNSPLFVKLNTPIGITETKSASSDSACEVNSCTTSPTPCDNISQIPPPKPQRLRLTNSEFRPSSVTAMQVIRETTQSETRKSSIGKITETILPGASNQATNGKFSIFWVVAGDITISLPIYYNAPDRLRLLFDIFTQKSESSQNWHFGIDDHEFTLKNRTGEKKISSLSKKKNASQYWFSTGDLAVPFTGKYMQPQKIRSILKFLRDYMKIQNETLLRFGIDDLEFSNINLSPESNYSLLLRLQSVNVTLPSHDQSETNRLSTNLQPKAKNKFVEELWARLQRQELILRAMKDDIRKLSGLHEHEHKEIIKLCKTMPEYVKHLIRMVRLLLKLQKAIGFDAKNKDQLDACQVLLNCYAIGDGPTK